MGVWGVGLTKSRGCRWAEGAEKVPFEGETSRGWDRKGADAVPHETGVTLVPHGREAAQVFSLSQGLSWPLPGARERAGHQVAAPRARGGPAAV